MFRFSRAALLTLILAGCPALHAQEQAEGAEAKEESAKPRPKPANPNKPPPLAAVKRDPARPSARLKNPPDLSHTKAPNHPSKTNGDADTQKKEEKDEHHGEAGCDKYKDVVQRHKCEQEEQAKRAKGAKPS